MLCGQREDRDRLQKGLHYFPSLQQYFFPTWTFSSSHYRQSLLLHPLNMVLAMRLSLATGTSANMNQGENWKAKMCWSLLPLAYFVTQLHCGWLLARLWNTQSQGKYASEALLGHPVPISWLAQCYFMALSYVAIHYEAKMNQYKYSMLRGGQPTATPSHWQWEITLENYLAVSYKVKPTSTLILSNSRIRYLPKRNENTFTQRFV